MKFVGKLQPLRERSLAERRVRGRDLGRISIRPRRVEVRRTRYARLSAPAPSHQSLPWCLEYYSPAARFRGPDRVRSL